MSSLPQSIQNLADFIKKFPGIGPKQALRIALYLSKEPKQNLELLLNNIQELKERIIPCQQCFLPALKNDQNNLCAICSDNSRNQNQVCVVERETDALSIDKTGNFKGVYHVVGSLSLETKNNFKINELLQRINNLSKKYNPKDLEIILAFNSNTLGETTNLYLQQKLKNLEIKISRLARGLSMGSEIEYADDLTLINALQNRK